MISVAWRELFAREASKACNACGVLHLRCCHKAQIQSALIGKSCHDERTGNRGGSKHPVGEVNTPSAKKRSCKWCGIRDQGTVPPKH